MTDHDEKIKEILLGILHAGFPGMKKEYEEVAWTAFCLGWELSLEIIRSKVEGDPCENVPIVGLLKSKGV